MLWKRKSVDPPALVPSVPAPAEADRALDTIAALLQGYGAHAFDTDQRDAAELRGLCDQWASQILLGGDGDQAEGAPRRNWGGVRRFFDEDRRAESAYVRATQFSLRSAVQAFARCFHATVHDEEASDDVVGAELEGLAAALDSNDPTRIRAAASSLSEVVRTSLSERRARQRAQLDALAEQLRSVRGELMQARERAALDSLTQLNNRASFDEHVQRIADLGLVLGTPPTLLMVDVDHFKSINDTHGHPAGDEVLRRVAECLVRNFLRKEDFVARYGGEEFAVVLMDASPHDAAGLAERLRRALRSVVVERPGGTIEVSASIGVASLVPGEDASVWIERADRALYRAKTSGRDCVRVGELPAAFE